MIGLRDLRIKHFGAALAGLALSLQLVFASWGMLVMSAPAEPADALGGHALCLAAATSNADQPVSPGSAPAGPAHDHLAFCCLWHALPGITPQAALLPQSVSYDGVAQADPRDTATIAAPQRGLFKARAPPLLA
jgi:hypothetical protein